METIMLAQKNTTAKLNMLLELEIDVLICNGITEFYYNQLSKNNIQVIPWINGEVEEVIDRYLKGRIHSIAHK
jgi:predicted Fe-Mo cluster-binding NifX family protein